MDYVDNNLSPLVKASWEFKKFYKALVLSIFSISWVNIEISYFTYFDLLIILPFFVVGSLIGVIIAYIGTSKSALNVYQNEISGKCCFGKKFSLPINNIQSVQRSGINGIKITAKTGKVYKFGNILNRDDVCTILSDLGVVVDSKLIKDKNAIITSKLDYKKHSMFKTISLISIILSYIFIAISAIWYNSSSNIRYYTRTSYYYYYGYKIPYEVPERGHFDYPNEMFTTYIALVFFVIFLVFIIPYFVQSNNKVSISTTMFRGVNGFGKVTLIPIEQIASTSIASGNSSITINQMGKKHKFYWLINNTLLCETINNIKAGKFESEKPEQPSNSVYETNPVGDDNNKTIAESAEEVKQLKALLDDGVITEEEFNSKKKQILNL